MRITIESTVSEPRYSVKSTVEVMYDDVDLAEMYVLFDQALSGCGYSPDPFEKERDTASDESAPE